VPAAMPPDNKYIYVHGEYRHTGPGLVQGLLNNMVLKEIRMAYLPSFRFLKVSVKMGHILLETEVVFCALFVQQCAFNDAGVSGIAL
jgi:hypothetical protein